MRYLFIITLILLPALALAVEVEPFQKIPFIDTNSTEGYINALYKASIAVAAFLVIFKLMWVGTKYMLTESVIKKGDAKGSIQNALIGLVIIISAALILSTINPNLLSLNVIEKVKPPEKFSGPTTIITSNDLYFQPGETWSAAKIAEHCVGYLPYVITDSDCRNQYAAALEKSCLENGGTRMDWIYEPNIDFTLYVLPTSWSWYSYTCVK